jgi:pimeloyl-ACP methyl ester carboxylesterase
MELLLSDNNTLNYSDSGDSDYIFICIHGGGGDQSHLQPQHEALSKIARSINVDLRGYGKSTATNGFGVIEQYVLDIYELIVSLDIENKKIILVGHSMGGMVAVEFAATYPQIVDGLIFISSGIIFPEEAKLDEEKFLNELSGNLYRDVLEELVNQLLPYKDNKSACDTVRETFLAASQEQWLIHFKSMMSWDKKAPDRLSYCKCPMLYIEDSGGCYSDIGRVKNICPQLVVGKTICSGHFPTIEVPDQVNAMITRFFHVEILN